MDTASRIKEETDKILARPYTRELIRNEDGTWFARVVEFVGCMTEGETAEKAVESLEEAMALWVEVRIEDGLPIPGPLNSDAYSGKFLMRVPKTLHRELARHADLEGVSLNQFALVALSRSVGIAC
ncbi:MAG TPA: type II toxin-antitoxin system HicB family antitoxin [Candidatus Acidoferrales bacterium]|jgi:antitoxin HicB|nr:type II toxin-antitoxin system HicB family antitoxin [Candidatus Acidoferrales bacterium]